MCLAGLFADTGAMSGSWTTPWGEVLPVSSQARCWSRSEIPLRDLKGAQPHQESCSPVSHRWDRGKSRAEDGCGPNRGLQLSPSSRCSRTLRVQIGFYVLLWDLSAWGLSARRQPGWGQREGKGSRAASILAELAGPSSSLRADTRAEPHVPAQPGTAAVLPSTKTNGVTADPQRRAGIPCPAARGAVSGAKPPGLTLL